MPDVSHDFGAHLRQAREQRGVSLRDIAERTKISVLALEALERNDISRLPGGIFTRAFVRAYAREVGLDPDDAIRRFVARFPDVAAEEAPRAYEANPEHIEVEESQGFGRGWRALAWVMPLLLGVAYFGFSGRLPFWGGTQAPASQQAEQRPATPPPPAAPAATTPASSATTPPSSATTPGATGEQGATGQEPAPDLSAQAAPSAAAPAPSQQVPAAVPAAEPMPADGFKVTLATREACWVSVKVDGTSVYSGLMQPGERKNLALRGQVSLTVGNAGVLDLFINDRQARSLGGTGQVVTARLNADNLKTFLDAR
jgi:cytoskeletal protein RodZ